jgi:hypothetical protein
MGACVSSDVTEVFWSPEVVTEARKRGWEPATLEVSWTSRSADPNRYRVGWVGVRDRMLSSGHGWVIPETYCCGITYRNPPPYDHLSTIEYDKNEKKLADDRKAEYVYKTSPEGLAAAAAWRAKWEADEKILKTIPEKERYWYATYVLGRPRHVSQCTTDVVPGPGPAY